VLIVIAGAALVVSLAVLVVIVSGGGDSDTASAPERPNQSTSTQATSGSSVTGPSVTSSTTPTPVNLVPVQIVPVRAAASSVLGSQRNSCNGERSTYGPENATDGDLQTAWAPQESDGAGQHLTLDLGQDVQLTSVGLVPGYAKVGPLSSSGCAAVPRFDLNRQVVRVRYRFDDGSTVEQSFQPSATVQTMAVDATTRSVDIEVLQTVLPDGPDVDDDTLISEVVVEGSPRAPG
jgi:hypothetical protein